MGFDNVEEVAFSFSLIMDSHFFLSIVLYPRLPSPSSGTPSSSPLRTAFLLRFSLLFFLKIAGTRIHDTHYNVRKRGTSRKCDLPPLLRP